MSPWEKLARFVTKKCDVSKACSIEAKDKVDVVYWRDAVLAEYEKGAATADEVAYALGADVLTIRPRVAELKRAGILVSTGLRRINDRGNKCAVLALLGNI